MHFVAEIRNYDFDDREVTVPIAIYGHKQAQQDESFVSRKVSPRNTCLQ